MDDVARLGTAADPGSADRAAVDRLERALVEVDAAISLVALGVAVTVSLCALAGAERVAVAGASRAQAAGVAFRLRHDDVRAVTLVIGPRIAPTIVFGR
jgi:hypothetical protein